MRASSDLIQWYRPIGSPNVEPGRMLYCPTFIGETGGPTIGGPAPRVYFTFTSFPVDSFPKYPTSVFETIPLAVSKGS